MHTLYEWIFRHSPTRPLQLLACWIIGMLVAVSVVVRSEELSEYCTEIVIGGGLAGLACGSVLTLNDYVKYRSNGDRPTTTIKWVRRMLFTFLVFVIAILAAMLLTVMIEQQN